ncbi:MAG: TIGR03808 family TAT-translocated repetitive protein [Alphaproteobacteria bacterium]|nr:MAG: TIGR03808 family TAT-translocated repetitive protein [Alphaproteobacteria bacterium]
MSIDRRYFLGATAATGAFTATETIAAPATSSTVPVSGLGVDAIHLGVRFNGSDDSTEMLQRAIDRTAGARLPLILAPGVYRARGLVLPTGARLVGVPGATRIVATENAPIIVARGADHILLSGIIFDGGGKALPGNSGLIQLAAGRGIAIRDCEVVGIGGIGGIGILLEGIEGEITTTTVTGAPGAAIHALDSRGLIIARNTIRNAANNGIQVWRSQAGDDGTQILDNRIEDTAAQAGGSGQNGNAINVFRAHNVSVRGNRIRNAAFSAVRGNAASNIQITSNSCTGLGEVAIYAEFGFEGAVIANNTIDGAAIGVAVTNFNQGGRLAVVSGNLIRNLVPKRPAGTDPNDGNGIGIGIEADAAVTGNVIENAPVAGISVGWGQYLRDVSVTGNVVRGAGVGIAVSVTPGAGSAVIADNLIAAAKNGAIVGMDQRKPMTGDLARDGAARYAQLAINGNRVR